MLLLRDRPWAVVYPNSYSPRFITHHPTPPPLQQQVLANNIAALFYESDQDSSQALDLRDFNEFLHVATGGRRSEEL